MVGPVGDSARCGPDRDGRHHIKCRARREPLGATRVGARHVRPRRGSSCAWAISAGRGHCNQVSGGVVTHLPLLWAEIDRWRGREAEGGRARGPDLHRDAEAQRKPRSGGAELRGVSRPARGRGRPAHNRPACLQQAAAKPRTGTSTHRQRQGLLPVSVSASLGLCASPGLCGLPHSTREGASAYAELDAVPTSAFRASTLSVASHGRPSRPKWPLAAVSA